MSNGITGATYSVEDYNIPGAGQPGGVLNTYQQEIAAAQKEQEEIAAAAKMQVLGKRQKQAANSLEVYGTTLGRMYDGDRAAVEFMRKHIEETFNSGGYENNPSEYARAISQLETLSTGLSTFYTTSYGDDSANGAGTTYMDMMYNQSKGVSNPFEADGMMYNPDIDPFDQAEKTLTYLNAGGYAPNSLRINDEGILVARELTYNADGNHVVGEEVPFDQLKHRELGNQSFMPDLVEDNKSLDQLAIANQTNINAYRQRINPATGTYYTFDEANDMWFRDEIRGNVNFAQQVLKGQGFEREEIAAYVNALNKGEDVSTSPIHFALYGGEKGEVYNKETDTFDLIDGEARTPGIVDTWKDKANFSQAPAPSAPPKTMRHHINAGAYSSGNIADPAGMDIEYDIQAQEIEDLVIQGSIGGASEVDYTVNGISADHHGNRFASVATPVQFIEMSNGTRVLYENEDQLNEIMEQDPDAEVIEQMRNKFVQISGDKDWQPTDPRAGEILDNLIRQGYEKDFGGIMDSSRVSYDAAEKAAAAAFEDQRAIDAASNVQPQPSAVGGGAGGAAAPAVQYRGMSDQEFEDATEYLGAEEREEALIARYNDEDLVKKRGDDTYELPDGTIVKADGSASGANAWFAADALYKKQFAAREDFKRRRDAGQEEDDSTVSRGPSSQGGPSGAGPSDPTNYIGNDDPLAGIRYQQERMRAQAEGANAGGLSGIINNASAIASGTPGSSDGQGIPTKEAPVPEVASLGLTPLEEVIALTEEEKKERDQGVQITDPVEDTLTPEQQRERLLGQEEYLKYKDDETAAYWNNLQEKIGYSARNFWETPYANEEELFRNDGVNTITDNETLRQAIITYGNPPEGSAYRTIAEQAGLLNDYEGEYRPGTTANEIIPGSDPDLQRKIDNIYAEDMEFERGGASEVATRIVDAGIAGHEGYTEDRIQMNVPPIGASGITIAGLDLGGKAGAIDTKLDILRKFLPDDVITKLEDAVEGGPRYDRDTNNNGTSDADEALSNAGLDDYLLKGKTDEYNFGLTQKQLNQISSLYLDVVLDDMYGRLADTTDAGEEAFGNLPEGLQNAMADVQFMTPGPTTLKSVKTAIASGKREDWDKVLNNYNNYYGTPAEVNAKLSAKPKPKLSQSNVDRTKAAAAQVEKYIFDTFITQTNV